MSTIIIHCRSTVDCVDDAPDQSKVLLVDMYTLQKYYGLDRCDTT